MTYEEIMAQIYDDPEVYRPPIETGSALLEVTHGCSWGKCAFCDFARDAYYHFDLEAIERKIKLLSRVIDGNYRLYFLGSNPFCLSTQRLLRITDMVHKYLPSVEEISMYARADDINRKSWLDMNELREAGITDLHVGLESGSDKVLKLHNKGETVYDIARALDTLSSCDMQYNLTAIVGAGGRALSKEHAEKTAEFLSHTTPFNVWCMGLKIWPNTPLEKMVADGTFDQMTPLEMLKEERYMLSLFDFPKSTLYVDSTALLKYTLSAWLPEVKDSLMRSVDRLILEAEERGEV